jgi:hypothetical protein
MAVYQVDPLRDPRWDELVAAHACASIFHTRGWLDALRRTYGYEPVVFTTSAPGQALADGVVFSRIQSWLTGRRMVSLPFADHCEPLAGRDAGLERVLPEWSSEPGQWRYWEMRPRRLELSLPGWRQVKTFRFHRLDLSPSLCEIYGKFHKNCIQRKIRRAERERLTCREGTSEALLREFYALLVLTRQRQHLAPQPLSWFRNLIHCLGNAVQIRVAYKDSVPVASVIMLRFKQTLTYKYGSSDRSAAALGGMHLLLWNAIQAAKQEGLSELDLGRSDWGDSGLSTFKRRWGAEESTLTYWRRGAGSAVRLETTTRAARAVIDHLPRPVLTRAGSLLYRHIG